MDVMKDGTGQTHILGALAPSIAATYIRILVITAIV